MNRIKAHQKESEIQFEGVRAVGREGRDARRIDKQTIPEQAQASLPAFRPMGFLRPSAMMHASLTSPPLTSSNSSQGTY